MNVALSISVFFNVDSTLMCLLGTVSQKIRPSICFQTCGQAPETINRAFETLSRAFKTLGRTFKGSRENYNLGRLFEKLGRMFLL